MKRAWLIIPILLCFYVCAYGAARWRKILVMHETYIEGGLARVRWVDVGEDIRDDWIGRTKNGMAPWAYRVFLPLVYGENWTRGGRSEWDEITEAERRQQQQL